MKKDQLTPRRRWPDYLKIFGCGFIMGGADVVPGVSGGTMAFILGIYQELLEAIQKFTSPDFFRLLLKGQFKMLYRDYPWRFLVALGLGIVGAIVIFATPIRWLLAHKLSLILSFFFGLVAASVVTVIKKISRWGISRYVALLCGGAAGFLVVGLPLLEHPPQAAWYLVLCGAIAICAMILPGISGSFMLLLLGKYDTVLTAVHELKSGLNVSDNLLILGLFIIGIVIGISSFVRILGYLLRTRHDVTVAVLIGFMIGSLRKVWPWKVDDLIENANTLPAELDGQFVLALILAAAGFGLVLLIEFQANKLQQIAQKEQ